ncbi:MAG: phage tail tube protein [Planctomycetota bacterium]
MPNPGGRIGGTLAVKIDGEVQLARGSFEYDLGVDKREAVVGLDRLHGFKHTPKPAYCAGELSDTADCDVKALLEAEDVTVVLDLANGKSVVFRNATQTGDGTVNPEEGTIGVRYDGPSGEELT